MSVNEHATGAQMALQLFQEYPEEQGDAVEALVCVALDNGQTLDQAVQTAREALAKMQAKPAANGAAAPTQMSAYKNTTYKCPHCGGKASSKIKTTSGENAIMRTGAKCGKCKKTFSTLLPGVKMSAIPPMDKPEKIKKAGAPKPDKIHPRVAARPDSVWKMHKTGNESWMQYRGPRGGRGWKNQYGEILYQENQPHGKHQGVPIKHLRHAAPGFTIGMNQGNVARFRNQIDNLDKSVAELTNAAQLGRSKKGWYARAHKAIYAIFGKDAPRFVAILAATSPRQPVNNNLEMSLDIYEKWVAAGRPGKDQVTDIEVPKYEYEGSNLKLDENDDPIPVLDHAGNPVMTVAKGFPFMKDVPGATFGSRFPNAMRALLANDDELASDTLFSDKSFKVESFRHNLMGKGNKVTLDTWMAAAFKVAQKLFGTKLGYEAGEMAIRKSAKQLGWEPMEVQETVWSVFYEMARLNHFDKSATGILDNLRNEGIAGIPEFASHLLEDPDVRQKIEELGFGEKAEAYSRQEHAENTLTGRAEAGVPDLSLKSAQTVAKKKLREMVKEHGVPPNAGEQLIQGIKDKGDVYYNASDDKFVKPPEGLTPVPNSPEIAASESEIDSGKIQDFLLHNKRFISKRAMASEKTYVRAKKGNDGKVTVSFVQKPFLEFSMKPVTIEDLPRLLRLRQAGKDNGVFQMACKILDVPIVLDGPIEMAAHHAPKGYTREKPLVIRGRKFIGGEFIPAAYLEHASPEQKNQIEAHGHPGGKPPIEPPHTKEASKPPEDEEAAAAQRRLRERIDRIGKPLYYKIARTAAGHGHAISLDKHDFEKILQHGIVGFVSAGRNDKDPAEKALSDHDVERRYGSLQSDLVEGGFRFVKVRGKYGEEEDSFMVMVPEAERHEMIQLGKKYNQDSILYSDSGKNEQIYTTGPNEGKKHAGEGWKMSPEAEDFFTTFIANNGEKLKFSLNLDFDKPAMMSLLRQLVARTKNADVKADAQKWLDRLVASD